MERILISTGVVLSLGGVWLMIEANIVRHKILGPMHNIGGNYDPKKYRWGWILLIIGAMAQIAGTLAPLFFPGISSAFASAPVVKSLTESGKSILDWLKQIEPMLYAVIVIFTGLAAGAAWLSARATRKATQSQLYIRLMEEYGSQEMSDALRGIKKFSELKDISPALAELRKILREGRRLNDNNEQRQRYTFNSDTIEINLEKHDKFNSDRRVVKYYFLKLLRLHENKFLPKKLMKELGKVAGIDLFYDVVQPIEFAKKENFNVSNFKKIYEICGPYDEGG